jgi:membrane protease YdiL (CAAX protease family)
MHPVRLLLIYAGAVFLGGALMAPWLFWGVQSLAVHLPVLEKLTTYPFHLYVNRSILALALIGLWPMLRASGVSAWRDVGLVKPTGQRRNLACGFALGFASLAGVAGVVLTAGARELNSAVSAGGLVEAISRAALTSAVVAVLEEILFRGAIFGMLRKTVGSSSAVAISSVIYALVHFFSQPLSPAEIHWSSGLALLPTMLSGFVEVERVVPGFFNLTVAGALLALAFQHTDNLYFSIGLHAGWIFWLKFYRFLTRDAASSSGLFWGTGKLIDGWLALIALGFVWWLMLRWRARAPAGEVQPAP